MSPVDPGLQKAITDSIEADYKRHMILPGNRIPPVERLLSKNLAINYVTGGGYPLGMMTRLWGAFSCGKTTELFNIFAQAQARDMDCMYVCTEKVFDHRLAVACGVNLKKLHLFHTQGSRRIETIGEVVAKALAAWHVIGVDSTTGTFSMDELATDKGAPKDVGDTDRTTGMNRARKWGYNMDWWQDRMNPENLLIFTSQVQSSIGMTTRQQIEGEKAPGGHKLNHEPALILHFMKAARLKRRPDGGLTPIGEGGGDKGAFGRAEPAGGELVIRCDKNKVGKQGRIVLLHHDKRIANFDVVHDYEKLAKYFGVVKRTTDGSSWYLLPDGSKSQSIRASIEESPDLVRRIEDVVMRCACDPAYEDRILRGGPLEEMVAGVG